MLAPENHINGLLEDKFIERIIIYIAEKIERGSSSRGIIILLEPLGQ